MIGDGICDDVSNIDRCLFDGGDCCESKKDTLFCSSCTCKIDFDPTTLNDLYKTWSVKVFENISQHDRLFTAIPKSVEDVETKETCSYLCLDGSLEDQVNSWTYDFDTRQCDCTWVDIDATLCTESIALLPLFGHQADKWYRLKEAMLKLHIPLPCGNKNVG